MEQTIGEVENVEEYEIKQVEWRIPDILTVSDAVVYSSPNFYVRDDSWNLRLFLRCGFFKIDICNPVPRDYSVEYSLGLKVTGGAIKEFGKGGMTGQSDCTYWHSLIREDELHRRQSELMPSNILTVTCTLKWKTSGTFANTIPDENLCKICMQANIECLFLNCGHMVTCTKCGQALENCPCPICRKVIERVVRVFQS